MLAIALLAQLTFTHCDAAPNAPALDHAIIVARDVDKMADTFRAHGFRTKRGRLHANGLDNRHIKFPDGTEIELMTVRGTPRDAMATRYADLMRAGDGGVYVALKVKTVGEAERRAAIAKLSTRRSGSGPWQFLGFNDNAAAAVFFNSGDAAVQDADSIFAHEPRVTGLSEIWVEGGPQLIGLLRSLGAVDCGRAKAPDGREGRRLRLSKGRLVVVPSRGSERPRVLGAVLNRKRCSGSVRYPIANFWLGCIAE